MADDKLFYVGQKAFINKSGSVPVLNDPNSKLDFPGGKIQIGENDFEESLRREVREETGLEIKIGDPFVTWYFEFKSGHRNAGKQVFLVGYRCEFVSGEVKLSNEHDSFQWVDKATYDDVDDRGGHFKALEKYFSK
ncbi:MAG: NUDIX domain-containing protein [Candidatus Taylorbacteria bacterium]|nr:NUDIX domain-containing protein [Candidatus Taylorbacteria bacterium]